MTNERPRRGLSSDPRRSSLLREELTETAESAQFAFESIESWLNEFGISIDKNTKILEVGTGQGKLLEFLNNSGHDVVGIDARPRHDSKLPIATARIEALPFRDGVFDLVIAEGVFDDDAYIQEQGVMLAEVGRVLKAGGVFFAGYHMPSAMPENMELLFKDRKSYDPVICRKK